MAGRDRIIDPVTKDYVKNSAGGYKTTRTIGTKAYHQLMGHRGQDWSDEDAGSDLHEAKHHGAGAEGVAFVEDAIKVGLSRLIREGLAHSLKVEAVAVDGRIEWDASAVDIQGAEVAIEGVTPFEG